MKIRKVVEQLGVSAETLRYYERIGMIPHIPRDENGDRNYEAIHLEWIQGILQLKSTGMSIEMLVDYVQLAILGANTAETRKGILEEERLRIEKEIAILNRSLSILDHKINDYYTEVLPKTENLVHDIQGDQDK